jgi:hypothetical protein
MSQWLTIKNQEDVDFDDSPMTEASIDVYLVDLLKIIGLWQ